MFHTGRWLKAADKVPKRGKVFSYMLGLLIMPGADVKLTEQSLRSCALMCLQHTGCINFDYISTYLLCRLYYKTAAEIMTLGGFSLYDSTSVYGSLEQIPEAVIAKIREKRDFI